MSNIKTADDIRNWAKTIVEADGNKFIPLSKGDMLAIAKYILSSAESTSTYEFTTTTSEGVQPNCEEDGKVDKSDSVSENKHTRMYVLHKEGVSTQQAYDRYLEWAKEHPKDAVVMDFSTGVKSNVAGFAYWLGEEIPYEER